MRPRSISNPLFVQPKTWSMDIDVSLSFFISSFFPRSFFRKSSSSSSSSSPSFLLHARNKTCSLEKEEEERKIGLSFLTTSWKSRCLNRRVEFFSFLSLSLFIRSFFQIYGLPEKVWRSCTNRYIYIYTHRNRILDSMKRMVGGSTSVLAVENRSINEKVFENWNSRTLQFFSRQEEEEIDEVGRDSFWNFLFLGPLSSPHPMSLSLSPVVANFSPTTIVLPLPGLCSPRDIARRRLDPEGQCALLFR